MIGPQMHPVGMMVSLGSGHTGHHWSMSVSLSFYLPSKLSWNCHQRCPPHRTTRCLGFSVHDKLLFFLPPSNAAFPLLRLLCGAWRRCSSWVLCPWACLLCLFQVSLPHGHRSTAPPISVE